MRKTWGTMFLPSKAKVSSRTQKIVSSNPTCVDVTSTSVSVRSWDDTDQKIPVINSLYDKAKAKLFDMMVSL
jgi:hypothetical protein